MRMADTYNFSVIKILRSPPQTPHEAFIALTEHTLGANGLYHLQEDSGEIICLNK